MTEIRDFYVCSNCKDSFEYGDPLPENMTTTSAEFPFCELGDGHFYLESHSSTDGRSTTECMEVKVVRNPDGDIQSVDPSKNRNGGDYDFTSWLVVHEEAFRDENENVIVYESDCL